VRPTLESLNVPGQKFTGTVKDNLIEGVFEIEHERYDSTGAPLFPVMETAPELAEYLAADGVFEADDAVLVKQAREITAGCANTWEAATRLAQWVATEIAYAIPGGGTARRTYDIRAGECGAHSILLATFCRAVGIPARMVWGCMYTPNQGGTFGQHGWTEVHMGGAGWIPLDATVGETDFVDSGHIRVAHFSSLVSRLNAQEFEILEYEVAGGDAEANEAARQRYAAYLGRYRSAESSAEYEVKVMDGSLVIEVPNEILLALEDPDEQGRWVSKLAKHVYVNFERGNQDGTEIVEALALHELHALPRRTDSQTSDTDAPAELVPYLGRYHLAAITADFEVFWKNGGLKLRHPRIGRALGLEPTGEAGSWKTQDGPYTISFVRDSQGSVRSMTLDAAHEGRKR
jgi:hypothetical protein